MGDILPNPQVTQEYQPAERYHWLNAVELRSEKDIGNVLDGLTKELLGRLKPRFGHLANWDDIEFVVQQFVSEICSNAILHGNYGEQGKKEVALKAAVQKYLENPAVYKNLLVKLHLEITSSGFKIICEDEGQGFDVSNLPDPTANENLLEDKGRGIKIVKILAAQSDFEPLVIENLSQSGSGQHGTRVKLEKNFK